MNLKKGKFRKFKNIKSKEEQIILELVKVILDAVYHSEFKETSRIYCHKALRDIRVVYVGTRWFIKGDICFKEKNHKIIIKILKRRISDVRFINLIRKILNAGYLEKERSKIDLIDLPKENLISPILSNIYLNELDKFMEVYKKNFDKGDHRKENPEYVKLSYQRQYAIKKKKN